MLLSYNLRIVVGSIAQFLVICAARSALPLTLESFAEDASCPDNTPSVVTPDTTQGYAMLQKSFKMSKYASTREHAATKQNLTVFRWGISSEGDHPPSIGKSFPHPPLQEYEAKLPRLSGTVLNIFARESNGHGGLLIALEVPAHCGGEKWLEVDRARCSSKYPCSLRLPSAAVRSTEAEPTRFRTRVISEDADYLTDYLEYKRVTLDHDAEVTIAHEKFGDDVKDMQLLRKFMKFSLDPVLASGALSITPVVQGATAETQVTMKIRQPKGHETASHMDAPKYNSPAEKEKLDAQHNKMSKVRTHSKKAKNKMSKHSDSALLQFPSPAATNLWRRLEVEDMTTKESRHEVASVLGMTKESAEMKVLDTALQSYRAPWAGEWRSPVRPLSGCGLSYFEVPADDLYPGEVELEVTATGGTSDTFISDVLVTTRVSWAEAEITLLQNIMKDHFGYFNDPEVIIHGLPITAYDQKNKKRFPQSNPAEWGYAMESWIIMAETGVVKPDETVAKLRETFKTLDMMQNNPDLYARGMFYPLYFLRNSEHGEKIFPKPMDLRELPCGDDALLHASLMVVQGWLKQNSFHSEADTCGKIIGRMNFSHCQRATSCGDKEFWAVPLTVNADTLEQSRYNWNVWADEGGLVGMIVALKGVLNMSQYESVVRSQMKYSPCGHWEGITVGHTAFFNSIFTLPTRSILGFGTLFSTPYYHEFAVRTVLPTFRSHQKLKKILGVDYMGPSDAMTVTPRGHDGRVFGSYAYWPPNNLYDCEKGVSVSENGCTWCHNRQMEGADDPFSMIVPHGNMASFLASAMMERSLFTAWLEDTKLLMTDASNIYTPGYGFEVMAPARRTPLGGTFEGGADDGRSTWEALSHGYSILSMYEGLANMRRRFELAKQAGLKVPGSYEPPKYKPLSDFLSVLPEVRSKINGLMAVAWEHRSQEKQCRPSEYGPVGP